LRQLLVASSSRDVGAVFHPPLLFPFSLCPYAVAAKRAYVLLLREMPSSHPKSLLSRDEQRLVGAVDDAVGAVVAGVADDHSNDH